MIDYSKRLSNQRGFFILPGGIGGGAPGSSGGAASAVVPTTWNPLDKQTSAVLSNSNLTVTGGQLMWHYLTSWQEPDT